MKTAEQRFLVVRLGSLGDIVHTFPAVAALRATSPNSEIAWITQKRWEPLVESSELSDEILCVDTRSLASVRQAIAAIKSRQIAAAIDYQGLWKSAALPFLSRIPKRIGFAPAAVREAGVPILYNERVQVTSAHVVEQNGELSQRAGAVERVAKFTLRVPETSWDATGNFTGENGRGKYVVLSPGGGWRSKCWPAGRYGALCDVIERTLGLRCIVNFGPGEEPMFSTIKEFSKSSAPHPFNGSLEKLMVLMRDAACVVGGDTGPLHLAAALNTPVVGLFGPTDPARNGPYTMPGSFGAKHVVLRDASAVTTYKRGEQADPSMLLIQVDEVAAAVRSAVERAEIC